MKMRASKIDLQPFCRMKLALRQSSFPGDSSKNIQGQFERVQYTLSGLLGQLHDTKRRTETPFSGRTSLGDFCVE